MSKKLSNMTAIVTGAANGIGKSTTELFAREGANLLIVDIDQKLPEVAKKIGGHYLRLDASEEESWEIINSYVQGNFSGLDILVNNAGITGLDVGDQTPENISVETWDKISKNNMQSVFLGCKYAIKMMKDNKNDCAIVNVASRSGFVGVPNLAGYAASKASIVNYTKSVALYCAQNGYNIRCNTVAPAAILTNMWNHLIKTEEDVESFAQAIPLKKMGEPQDVANAILYLSSSDSSFTNGTEIVIDGGILAGSPASPNTSGK